MEKARLAWSLIAGRQVNPAKALAFLSNASAYYQGRFPRRYPPVLMIDPSNICNLRCSGCLTTIGGHPKPPGVMEFECFRGLINEVAQSTVLCVLYNSGEPFLNPALVDMIEYLGANRIASITSTNGELLDDEKLVARLVKSGLNMMIVSLSGATQDVHRLYHRRGNLQRVVQNLKLIAKIKNRMRSRLPLIKTRFLIMDHNRHQLAEMKQLARSVGADIIDLRPVNTEVRMVDHTNEQECLASENPSQGFNQGRCLWPWLIAVVHWDGSVIPCCHLSLRLPEMGNAFRNEGLGPVWFGEKYNRFRRQLLSDKSRIRACRQCRAELGFQNSFNEVQRVLYVKSKR